VWPRAGSQDSLRFYEKVVKVKADVAGEADCPPAAPARGGSCGSAAGHALVRPDPDEFLAALPRMRELASNSGLWVIYPKQQARQKAPGEVTLFFIRDEAAG
jgi:hypothetical protein